MDRYIDVDSVKYEIIKARSNLQMLDNTELANEILIGLRIAETIIENEPIIEIIDWENE